MKGTRLVKMQLKGRSSGFTLIEVLIVVVIMAVLAATIIPQFAVSTDDAKVNTAKFNLNSLRTIIQLYRTQHEGKSPSADLKELTAKTDLAGAIGTGSTHIYGPYLTRIPDNPKTNSNVVRAAAANPPAAASGETDAGWLYHAASGNIWLDDAALLSQ